MKHSLPFIFLFNVFLLDAQLETSGGHLPYNLVHYVLSGNGISVSNVVYTGAEEAIGVFDATNTSLGMDEGVLLTTGTIADVEDGPHGPNDKPNAGFDTGTSGHPLFTDLAGNSTYNVAVLEFDFIPLYDTIEIEYIFGSDEYPEWVGDQYNDVFALFISGPGIQDTLNIAKIPGTSQPVAINTINNGTNNTGPCTNCNYYVNNGIGSNEPFNSDEQYIQYDGLTVPLKAEQAVIPGETYHLIIGIADVGDGIYDSGLFLKRNSFVAGVADFDESKSIKVYPNPSNGTFFIEHLSSNEIRSVEVYSSDGKAVLFNLSSLDNTVSKIEMDNAVYGIYSLKIILENGDFYSKNFVID